MSIYARVPESKYVVAPEGLHPSVCCDVVDLGVVATQFGPKHKVELRWQIAEAVDSPTGPVRPIVRERYTNSLHEKAKLRLVLETWRGRKFTKPELAGFDLEKLIGASCQVQVIHNVSAEGRTFANVNAVIPLGKGMPTVEVEPGYVRQHLRTTEGDPTRLMPGLEDGSHDDPIPF